MSAVWAVAVRDVLEESKRSCHTYEKREKSLSSTVTGLNEGGMTGKQQQADTVRSPLGREIISPHGHHTMKYCDSRCEAVRPHIVCNMRAGDEGTAVLL